LSGGENTRPVCLGVGALWSRRFWYGCLKGDGFAAHRHK
jgi:hypothetical protein